MPKTKVKIRNPVVRAAASLLAKGGVHTQSPSAKRRQERQQLKNEVDDFLTEREINRSNSHRGQSPVPGDKTLKYLRQLNHVA